MRNNRLLKGVIVSLLHRPLEEAKKGSRQRQRACINRSPPPSLPCSRCMLQTTRRTPATCAHFTHKAARGLRAISAMLSDGGEQRQRRTVVLRACTAALLLVCLISLMSWAPWRSSGTIARLGLRRVESEAEAAVAGDGDDADLDLGPSPFAALTHLVLVAGHAVLTSTDVHDITSPSNWALLSYQRDQLSTFVAHIRRGVEIARDDPQALLIFSGGETREKAGPRSESQSYWTAANHAHWFAPTTEAGSTGDLASSVPPSLPSSMPTDVSSRAVTEEYARDSFENLLFSLCRFREVTGHYPARVTVVGFSFKAERFRTLHRAALRFPEEKFRYEGIDPPMLSDAETDPAAAAAASKARAALLSAEQTASFRPFQLDPYSCHPPLSLKKRARNPFRRSHRGYEHSCPEIKPLMRFCKRSVFQGPLPWADSNTQAVPVHTMQIPAE